MSTFRRPGFFRLPNRFPFAPAPFPPPLAMKPLPDHLHSLLAQATELRAAGNSWDAIAVKLGRSAYTCRRWPVRYPRQWDRLFRRAAPCRLSEASGEALFYLRRLLRRELNKLGQDAAKFLYGKELEWLARSRPKRRRQGRPRTYRERLAAYLAMMEEDPEVNTVVKELEEWKPPGRAGTPGWPQYVPAEPAAGSPLQPGPTPQEEEPRANP